MINQKEHLKITTMKNMKSKTLALIITGLILLLSYATSVAHDLEEGFAIVCGIAGAVIMYYVMFYLTHEIIKIIRDED